MSIVAVVADDLTGAADAAAGFLRFGFTTSVTWREPTLDTRLLHQVDAIAVDLRTRIAPAAEARATTEAAVTELFHAGVTTLYKKIDSMLRGHVGEEVSGALTAWAARNGSIAIVAPAFPAMGRTTIEGRQRVHGVVLDRPSIPSILQQSGLTTGVVDISATRADARRALARCLDQGARAIVCDAELDEDLEAIAVAGAELGSRVVWVGTAGLAHAVARTLAPRTPRRSIPVVATDGPILIVVGSTAPIAAEQTNDVRQAGAAHIEVTLDALEDEDSTERRTIVQDIESLLAGDRDIVITIASERIHDQPEWVAARLARLLERTLSRIGGLVITGGETATQVLRACGSRALYLIDEIEPGVPLAWTVGARSIPVITKAGSFGTKTTLTHARSRLREIVGLARQSGSKQEGRP